jgi:hypothetical protein
MASGASKTAEKKQLLRDIKENFKDVPEGRIENTFAYQPKVWRDYLLPFLVTTAKLGPNTTFAEFQTFLKSAKITASLGKSLVDFHKFVLPLCQSDIKGLPLYFSPRPQMSGAISRVADKFPLSSILMHPDLRPSAETASTVEEVKALILKDAKKDKEAGKRETQYYASIKFDGHAAIWTGQGFITKGGKTNLVWAPPELAREVKQAFQDQIVLGEIVLVRTQKENDSENFQGAGAEKGLHPERFHKSSISSFYAYNTGKSQAVRRNLTAATHRMVFMAYDLISYEYRNKPFKQRLEELENMYGNAVINLESEKGESISKLSRVRVIEQRILPSLVDTQKIQRKNWSQSKGSIKKFVDLLPDSGQGGVTINKMTEGEFHLNLMGLGCIFENQEGIVLTPNVPYYDLFRKKKRIKFKPRIRFMATLSEPAKSTAWFKAAEMQKFDGNFSFDALLLGGETERLLGEEEDSDEQQKATLSFSYRVAGRELFLTEGEAGDAVDEKYRSRVSLVNTFSFTGLPIDTAVKDPRPINLLIPNNMGQMARRMQQRAIVNKQFENLDDPAVRNKDFVEGCSLAQMGSNLRFREFNIVAANAFVKTLDKESEESRLLFKEAGPSHVPPFPNEPSNEHLFHLMASLIFDESDSVETSYNRWIPALKRAVDGDAAGWEKLGLEAPGPRLVCVKRVKYYDGEPQGPNGKAAQKSGNAYNLLEFLPTAVVLYERSTPNTNVYSYISKEKAMETSASNIYVDIRNLPKQRRASILVTIPAVYFSLITVGELKRALNEQRSLSFGRFQDADKNALTTRAELSNMPGIPPHVQKVFYGPENGGFAEYDAENKLIKPVGKLLYGYLLIRSKGLNEAQSAPVSEEKDVFFAKYSFKTPS